MAGSGETISDNLEKFRRAREASALSKPASKDKQTVSKSSMKRAIIHHDGLQRVSRNSKKQCSGAGFLSGGVSATSDLSLVIDDLNENHFPRDLEGFRESGFTVVLDNVQSLLFKAMSACHYGKIRYQESEAEVKRLSEDNVKIKKNFESEKSLLNSTITTKDQEVNSWMGKVTGLKDKITSLKERDQESRRVIVSLEQQLELAASSATIINTWRMIQEFLDGKATNWKADEAEAAYQEVIAAQAEMDGKFPPKFAEPPLIVDYTAPALGTG